MTLIAISGAAGRMGFMLIQNIARTEGLRLAGAVERKGHPDISRDAGLLAGCAECGVTLTDSIKTSLGNADVLIDFAFHDAVPLDAKAAAEAGKPMVIGTTGLNKDETAIIREASKHIPIVYAPNMSLGINLLFSVLVKAAKVLGKDYSISIDETHHIHKKDAPSGTALRLGEKVAEGLGKELASIMIHDEEGKDNTAKTAPVGQLPIRSYRQGEIVGDHTVIFENQAERIEFTHHAWGREAFALGALRAAQWVTGRKPGMYDMQDVLDLK